MVGSRVAVLGGGGRVGSAIVRGLADIPDFSSILVGDARAEQTASRLADVPKVEQVTEMDLNDQQSIVKIAEEADIVVNAIGPFYRYGSLALEAAIAGNAHYVDVCDDIAPTLEMLEMHDRAADAGVLGVIGAGNSPGFTNVVAALVAEECHELCEVLMSWVVPVGDGGGPAVGYHSLRMCSEPTQRVMDGDLREFPSLETSSFVELPQPFGVVEVFDIAHPEPVTLKRAFPALRESWNRGAVLPAWEMDRLAGLVRLGLAENEPLKVGREMLDRVAVALSIDADFRRRNPNLNLGPPISCTRVDVVGRKDDMEVRRTYILLEPMARGTGLAAVAGAMAVSRGLTRESRGVFAPEEALRPRDFMDLLAELGVDVIEQRMVRLSRERVKR